MKQKFSEQTARICGQAVKLSREIDADALLVLVEGSTDWERLKKLVGREKLLVVADQEEDAEGAREAGIDVIVVSIAEAPVTEKLTQALLTSVANENLFPGAEVVVVYSAFEAGKIDSISLLRLEEHLGRLTSRDLRQLVTHVPIETLKTVVDLAVEIGREGREGKAVGTMFVVGDSRKVLASSRAGSFDPVKGYKRKERNLSDPRVREGIKEAAQMDGAFVVATDGTVEAACRLIDASAASITLSKGLGARHWAGAAITRKTNAVAVIVSESGGTVRIFENGEVMLRIEPFRRAMKWKEFEFEPPAPPTE